jgi:hypothetical protein
MTARLPALFAALLASNSAWAGVHIGNIWLSVADDASPVVSMHPDRLPRLAVWTCGSSTPTLVWATESESGTSFALDSDMGTICKVGVDLGSPVEIKVGGVFVATADPVAEAFTVSPIAVSSLVGGTIRAGTNTMMSQLRALAAVPRVANNSEQEQISAALSVMSLDL